MATSSPPATAAPISLPRSSSPQVAGSPELLGNLPLPSGFLRSIPTMDIYQENAYHFPYRDQDPEARLAWPTYIHKDPAFKSYGLPGGRDASFRGQKVAEYMAGHRMDTASQQNGQIDPANRERVIEYVKKYLPGLEPTPYAETTCIFSATPTEDFIMDEADGITILSPCSGHGAKFGPLLGELAADLATGARETPRAFPPGIPRQGHGLEDRAESPFGESLVQHPARPAHDDGHRAHGRHR
ncbi:FAD-dependent oxidoreductase [Glutamicibacter halophytocola]|uniref:FAD-dependent oxidoreductase n=1 Tax=Glutamicibacter halophytocola TaxID=1933880 RepID=UPI00321B9A40